MTYIFGRCRILEINSFSLRHVNDFCSLLGACFGILSEVQYLTHCINALFTYDKHCLAARSYQLMYLQLL